MSLLSVEERLRGEGEMRGEWVEPTLSIQDSFTPKVLDGGPGAVIQSTSSGCEAFTFPH